MAQFQHILNQLPYGPDFLFVDGLTHLDEDSVRGFYRFRESLSVYQNHFPGNPITPGVLLIECMAQIGLVCLGIHLVEHKDDEDLAVAFSENHIVFNAVVLPGQQVHVEAEKVYFRFGKLKCKVRMTDDDGNLIASGTMSGMLKPKPYA